MSMDTLVLSSAYQPMAQVRWQRAFTMLASGRVEVVEEYQDRVVKTVDRILKVPAIVRFVGGVIKRWDASTKIRFTRTNVFLRDKGKCQYCKITLNKMSFTLDHVIPASKGGKKSWDNIVASCGPCNQRKRNKRPEDVGMKLVSIPKAPKYLSPLRVEANIVPSVWKHYFKK